MKFSELAPGVSLSIELNGQRRFSNGVTRKIDNETILYTMTAPFTRPDYRTSDNDKVKCYGDAHYNSSVPFNLTKSLDGDLMRTLDYKFRSMLVPQTFTCLTPPKFVRKEGHFYTVKAFAQVPSLSMLNNNFPSIEGKYNETLAEYLSYTATRTPRDAHLIAFATYSNVASRQAARYMSIPLLFKINGDFSVEQKMENAWSRTPVYYITVDSPKFYSLPEFRALFGGAQ